MLSFSCLVASRAVSASSGEPSAAGHGAHTARATPWPQFVPGRVRLLPRVILVPSVCRTVDCRALTDRSGELPTAIHGHRRTGHVFRSRFSPEWTRFLLRFLPVLSVLKTVHRSARLDNSGELPVAGNGGAAVSTPNSSGRASLFPFHQIPVVRSEINGPGTSIPLRGSFS
jgi:hypothetical protein